MAYRYNQVSYPDGKSVVITYYRLFDGILVTFTISTKLDAELVNTMPARVIDSLNDEEQPIVHSGRVRHYRSPSWIDLIENAVLKDLYLEKVVRQIMPLVKDYL